MFARFGNTLDVFGAFSDGFHDFGLSYGVVSGFLIEGCRRNGMVDRCFDIFVCMSELGTFLSANAVCRMLDSFIDANRIDIILDNYNKLQSIERPEIL